MAAHLHCLTSLLCRRFILLLPLKMIFINGLSIEANIQSGAMLFIMKR